jgi:hypothetical protein
MGPKTNRKELSRSFEFEDYSSLSLNRLFDFFEQPSLFQQRLRLAPLSPSFFFFPFIPFSFSLNRLFASLQPTGPKTNRKELSCSSEFEDDSSHSLTLITILLSYYLTILLSYSSLSLSLSLDLMK